MYLGGGDNHMRDKDKWIKNIALIVMLILFLPIVAFAQTEIVDVTKAVVESNVPLWEKFILGLISLVLIALGMYIWKGWPKVIDRKQRIKDEKIDEKIAAAEEIEIESNRLIKEVKGTMDRLMECHQENKENIANHDRDIGEIKKLLSEDKIDREKRQEMLDSNFSYFQQSLKEMREEFSNVQTDLDELRVLYGSNNAYMDKISEGALKIMLKDDKQELKHRARAALRLIALAVNGPTKKYIIKDFLLGSYENKDAFWEAVDDIKHLNLDIKDEGYFDKVMDEINERVYSGALEWKHLRGAA